MDRDLISFVTKVVAALAVMLPAAAAQARNGFSFATGIMALTNSTSQGGQGSKGSTLLTQTDATYHGGYWGAGLFFQYDKQGDSEVDTATGLRLEGTLDPFYLEYAYAFRMNRSFTDRAIAEQEGKGNTVGIGARFGIGTGLAFMQFSYKYRTQTVTTQDGEDLEQPITQIDGYPLFGIGIGF
jgi:hypothetical protein